MLKHWSSKPEDQDYAGARSYLSLLVGHRQAAKLTQALKAEKKTRHYAAKDILRAAGLVLLPPDDPEVEADMEKVRSGRKLSPVLLVMGEPLWVADGYHRVCVSIHLGEKTPIPCVVVRRKP